MQVLEWLVPGGLMGLALFVFVGWPLLKARQRRNFAASWSGVADRFGLKDSETIDVLTELAALPGVRNPKIIRSIDGEINGAHVTIVMFTYGKRTQTQSGSGHGSDGEATAVVLQTALPELHAMHAPERAQQAETLSANMPAFVAGLVPARHKPIRFSDDPAFSNLVVVTGPDATAIQPALGPPLRAFLLSHPYRHLTGTGTAAIWWFPEPFDGSGLERLIQETQELAPLVSRLQ